MIRPKSKKHNFTKLSARVDKSLLAYMTAASAAGVGMVATQPAQAEIVYTPANTPITLNTPVPLDLNNDGVVDFTLSNRYGGGNARPRSCTVCSFFEDATLRVTPEQPGNAIWGFSSNGRVRTGKPQKKAPQTAQVAAPVFWGVDAGAGPGRNFEPQALVMDSTAAFQTLFGFYSTKTVGQWGKGRPFAGPYLALKFTINGETHYGWARIAVTVKPLSITATLTGYAYETVPNRGILTGVTHGTLDDQDVEAAQQTPVAEPASLGRLAQGADGLSARRMSQTETAASK